MSSQHVAFSAVRNPANRDRVFIYRVAPNDHNLSYEQRAIHKGISAPRWNKNPEVPSTILRGESNIVTLIFDDVVHIYGVCVKDNLISLLSPFVEPLESKASCDEGKLAGVCFSEHDEEQAWLVYEKPDGEEDNAKSRLMYCDLGTPQTPDKPSTAKSIMKGTYLSLFHDTRRCWVIFQNESGQLVAHNETDQKPSVISADSSHFAIFRTDKSNVSDPTPIASCFIPAKDIDTTQVPGFRSDALGRVIVYWVRTFNGKPCLYRSHADLTERSSSADFSEPRQATENGVSVEPLAQISVVPNAETQSNYLFIVKHGGDNISSVADSWATMNESSSSLDMANTELFKRWQAKILEEAILGRGPQNGHSVFPGDRAPHHHHVQPHAHPHLLNGYSDRYINGRRVTEEELMDKVGAKMMVEEIFDEEVAGRLQSENRDMPLVWRNRGDGTKPQLHSGVISRVARSKWSEAEVQVMIPAGSTIMGDIKIQLKVRPTE
ncbi:hypothetical protein FPRO06_13013 [Fusarium proliferatum]|nr:hypothetical protein FPRO06_13013 [Fusarium proliferatum]CVL11706.1 uncharacterized protein FPRN_14918 [Fusarium proliferatum]